MILLSQVRLSPKKGGLYGCGVQNYRFFGQNCCFLAKNNFFENRPAFFYYVTIMNGD